MKKMREPIKREKTIITEDGRELLLYNQKWTDAQLEISCSPKTRKELLGRAWIAMQPGIANPYGKATIEIVAKYLRSSGCFPESAEWAAQIADKHYKREDFDIFMEELEK